MAIPKFKHVYVDDDILCYDYLKIRAIVGCLSTSPYSINSMCTNSNGWVTFYNKHNNKLISFWITSNNRHYKIGNFRKGNDVVVCTKGNCNEFYLRETIDRIILNIIKVLQEHLEIEDLYNFDYFVNKDDIIISKEDKEVIDYLYDENIKKYGLCQLTKKTFDK